MTPSGCVPTCASRGRPLAGFAALLYVLESALRGWDFRPTLMDGLVFGALALILILRPLVQRLLRDDEEGQ